MANPTDPFSASIIPFEVPEQMRAFAEKGVSQARDSYAKFKDVAESHNWHDRSRVHHRQQGRQRILRQADGNHEGQHHARRSTSPQELLAVKSPSEAMELWTSHASKQYETITAQAKELAELGQKVATETVEPIKTNASKLFKPAA